MSEDQVIELLAQRVAEAGGVTPLAIAWGIYPQDIYSTLGRKTHVLPSVRRCLGLRAVKTITYTYEREDAHALDPPGR